MNRDTQSAIEVLPELERVLGPEHPEYLLSASALAAVGEQRALQPLLDAIDSNVISDETVLKTVLASAVQCYVSIDRERDGLDRMRKVLDQCIHEESRSNEFRSYIANQLQMLYFGAEEIDNALKTARLAIQLFPKEPSYYFNLSVVHEKREDFAQAIKAIECCIEMNVNTPDRAHLFQAWDLYRQTGDRAKMKTLQDRLNDIGHRISP